MTDSAWATSDAKVMAAWEDYLGEVERVRKKRADLSYAEGRSLYVQHSGFGHGTRVVGFERFESDEDGDLVTNGSLIVSSKRGVNNGLVVPNLRRKSGKAYAEHLKEYTTPNVTLPGMPDSHIAGDGDTVGLRIMRPAIFCQDYRLYAFWPCPNPPVEEPWVSIPLSEYHLGKEAHDANKEG